MRLYTIGVYNSNEEVFFSKLMENHINYFIDIRRRRGVRGTKYSFVNSKKLQEKLSLLGIKYFHALDLAPTKEIREFQKSADKKNNENKNNRLRLSPIFEQTYRDNVLSKFNFESFFKEIPRNSNVALFCVEEKPMSCHRSIVAEYIYQEFSYPINHL